MNQPQSAVGQERRRFSRVQFDAAASLEGSSGRYPVMLVDISLKGALVTRPPGWQPGAEPWVLVITLSDGSTEIRMHADLAHEKTGQLGFHCREIDLDSIAHLRRLVELNTGDPALLERELAALL